MPNTRLKRLLPLAVSAILTSLPAPAQDILPEAQRHIDAARAIAADLQPTYDFFCVPGNARPNDFGAPDMTPTRLFDNLYVLGNAEAVVYVIDTGAGLVLLDAGMPNTGASVIEPGLQALGLDPAGVIAILLGHGHSDHYGSAVYFHDTYGTRIGTTDADWQTIESDTRTDAAIKPARDLVISNGVPLDFGGTVITPVAVPGHTPGALAFIFDVTDNGAPHTAGMFGGTVLATAYTPMAGLERYITSIAEYLEVAQVHGVDVEIQNHPIFDDTPGRLAALAVRTPGQPHPFVMGAERYQRFWRIVAECMQADIITRDAAGR
jgi:metallo-beta-lactamase class B